MKLVHEVFDEVPFDWAPIIKGWEDAFVRAGAYFDAMSQVMQTWFPIVSEAHRTEVKRVRTAYRRKRGKRW